jgi:N,N'-diacetyllegionaminate synthase
VRNVEASLGNGVKAVADAERSNIEVARKSIVAARAIKKGELLTEENITVKRPGNGLSPMLWDSVIGTKATANFDYDALITL